MTRTWMLDAPTATTRPRRPTDLDVLLLDAENRQALACMRAYARAGLRVGAAACEELASWAPSLQSRYCSTRATLPSYTTDPNGYVDGLLALVDEYQVAMVVPGHDGSIQAIRARRAEIERRTALPLGSEAALGIAVSKERTLALARDLGIAEPRGIGVRELADIAPALREVGLPAVIKPVQSWVQNGGIGTRLVSAPIQSPHEARRLLEYILAAGGGGALIQQWLPGRREAVSLMYARGRFSARVAQASHREWPLLGGVSVLCETIPLLPDITSAAERLIRAMDLEGFSMVEFRRDRHGQPVLMEVNPRMGGSLSLAIAAGVNFPALLHDWKLHGRVDEVPTYRVGQRLRWLPGDIWNLKCVFDSQGQPDAPSRPRAAAAFLVDFMRPANMLDVIELGDMRPSLAEMHQVVLSHGVKRLRRASVTLRSMAFSKGAI